MGGAELPAWQALIPFLVIGLVLAARLRRVGKARRLSLKGLLVLPAIYGVLATGLVAAMPPHGIGWLWCALALAAGSMIGWQRGRLVKIDLDRETGKLRQTQSIAGMLIVVGVLAARTLLRFETGSDAHKATALVTALMVAFALGLIAAQRIEMYVRARRLLRAAAPA